MLFHMILSFTHWLLVLHTGWSHPLYFHYKLYIDDGQVNIVSPENLTGKTTRQPIRWNTQITSTFFHKTSLVCEKLGTFCPGSLVSQLVGWKPCDRLIFPFCFIQSEELIFDNIQTPYIYNLVNTSPSSLRPHPEKHILLQLPTVNIVFSPSLRSIFPLVNTQKKLQLPLRSPTSNVTRSPANSARFFFQLDPLTHADYNFYQSSLHCSSETPSEMGFWVSLCPRLVNLFFFFFFCHASGQIWGCHLTTWKMWILHYHL